MAREHKLKLTVGLGIGTGSTIDSFADIVLDEMLYLGTVFPSDILCICTSNSV